MSKRKRKRRPTGKKCIYFAYCGNEVEPDSKEHAFPKNLMPQESRGHESPGIILEGYICRKCNNKFGELDEKVIRQSFIGWLHHEFETFEGRGSSSFYHKPHHDFPPLRILGVFKSNDLALLEPKDFILNEDVWVKKAADPMPSQIIVTRRNNMDSYADILDKNPDFRTFEKDVYCVDQNRVVVFGPIALKGYYDKREDRYKRGYYYKPDEFIQKFLTSVDGETFRVSYVPPDPDDPVRSQADRFMEFLDNTGRRTELASAFQIRDVIKLGPDTSRGIAKIAFHCFLYKNQERITGHEGMFEEIKAFIYNGDYTDKPLVVEHPPNDGYPSLGEHAIAPSSNPKCNVQHIFSFFKNGVNIDCISGFYVGAMESSLFTVILSGGNEDLLMEWIGDLRIPYEISRDHPLLERILHPTREITNEVERGVYPGNPQTKRIIHPSNIDIAEANRGDFSSDSLYEKIRYRW